MTSEYLGTADEIAIDPEERGLELWFKTDQGTFRVNIDAAASDLYEAVQRRIAPNWTDEKVKEYERQYAARRVFACDPDESGGYALDDPKHPDFHSVHADIWDARGGK